MGITIHYRFRVRSRDVALRLLSGAKAVAVRLGMKVMQEREMMLVLHPHPGCESINLHFRQWKEVKAAKEWDYCRESMQDFEKVLRNDDFVCADFTKTQYAGFKTHVIVAEFLRRIAGSCSLAYVSDEADYYETREAEKAAGNFEENAEMIRKVGDFLKEKFGDENVYSAIDGVEGE